MFLRMDLLVAGKPVMGAVLSDLTPQLTHFIPVVNKVRSTSDSV